VGTALDLGCGEGGGISWLAGRGWQVTVGGVSTIRVQDRPRGGPDWRTSATAPPTPSPGGANVLPVAWRRHDRP
jgi:hypothetical protein